MKTVCIVSSTRAEYGLLQPLIKKIQNDKMLNLLFVVTGMHLSFGFGHTIDEIKKDDVRINEIIPILDNASSDKTSKIMARALSKFDDFFTNNKIDLLIVLGDRFEMMSVCIAAMNNCIPIAHIHGGETTEGAIDEAIRHSITKMSYLHFTSTEIYKKRVIQLGEDPKRVFNVGALSVENILNLPILSKQNLEKELGFTLEKPYAMLTFHPVTLEKNSAEWQIKELFAALDTLKGMTYVFTKANMDADGEIINEYIEKYAAINDNMHVFSSLGVIKYLSAVKYCSVVIGNSSSGIIEAPVLGVPTVNIGDRQKGRLQPDTVIDVQNDKLQIIEGIERATSVAFAQKAKKGINLFGDGHTSEKILTIVKDYLLNDKISLQKSFYDIKFEV